MRELRKKGQVAIFVIVAIVIVGLIAGYFIVKGKAGVEKIPSEFQEVFDYYSGCIEDETQAAIDLAETQGGKIYVGDYEYGSDYAPFGNQLNFLGFPVPYWYYVSGNGLIKEQVPTKKEIEEGIERYVEENVNNCNFEAYYGQGFYIELNEARANANINDENVQVSVDSNLVVSKEVGGSARKSSYNVVVKSKLGKFYSLAREIYEYEMEDAFLENYSADVLRLYAPVDGVEISCSPKIWKTREVIDEIQNGLEANIPSVKFNGNYYELSEDKNKYFVVDKSADESVNLIYSKDWPNKVEIYDVGELMVASPVGNQQGMGLMGFCYAPYHFVYDMSFPVMIQIYDSREVFQFPVVVVIDKNMPREGFVSELPEEPEFDLCEYYTKDVEVGVYDVNLNSINANISYECFNQKCLLGKTEDGVFRGKAPACLNGYLLVRADGYADRKQLFSSSEESFADIILDREREVKVELKVGNEDFEGSAVVSFIDGSAVTAVLPEVNKVVISEGLYNVSVYAYSESDMAIPESKKTQCIEVPKSGLLGFLGGTRQECTDIVIPETKIESILIGGGSSEIYIFDSDLEKGKIKLEVGKFPKPDSLEDLQVNYAAFEGMGVYASFE